MRSLSKVLKTGQTVLGTEWVAAYEQSREKQPLSSGEEQDGEESNAVRPEQNTRYALISEEKRKILERARSQAEQSASKILESAYDQRDKITNTAVKEAERLKKQAEDRGYADGLVRAETEISQGIAQLRAAVDSMGSRFDEHLWQVKSRMTELALTAAEKILQKKVEGGGAELAELVEQALLSERDKHEVIVHISDESISLAEELERRLEPLRDRSAGYIRVRPEPEPPGYVQIETEDGIVDASVFVQLENLKEQLGNLLNK